MRQPVPFGKYLLLDRISVGGMAEVFKAKSYGVEGFEKIIAIKRILPTMGEDRDFIKMFIDEAKIAGQLAHANICQIFELGRIDGSHFIAMEYIWGKDLLQIQNRLRKNKLQMPIPMACFCIAKVLEGLDYAHRKRDPLGRPLEIVHRDCSPQNVLVSYEGEVKLIDFGIAKATSRNSRTMAGVLKGKFGYMSPEQVRGLPLDRRSDIFAIGTMLYECLTGERLFQGETDFSTLEKVRNVDIQAPRAINPAIPEAIEKIILKALAKDVDDRYQWCSEMLTDLQQFLMSQDVVFTAKSLSGWLKDVFQPEIDRERALLEQYKRVGRDGLIAGATAAAATGDVNQNLGAGEAPEPSDATQLGGPSFEEMEQGVGAAPDVHQSPNIPAAGGPRGSVQRAAASPAKAKSGFQQADEEGEGDFGEEAPTEIFGDDGAPPPSTGSVGRQISPPPAAKGPGKPPPGARPSSSRPGEVTSPIPPSQPMAAAGPVGRTTAPGPAAAPPTAADSLSAMTAAATPSAMPYAAPYGTPQGGSGPIGIGGVHFNNNGGGAPGGVQRPGDSGEINRTVMGVSAPPGLPNYANNPPQANGGAPYRPSAQQSTPSMQPPSGPGSYPNYPVQQPGPGSNPSYPSYPQQPYGQQPSGPYAQPSGPYAQQPYGAPYQSSGPMNALPIDQAGQPVEGKRSTLMRDIGIGVGIAALVLVGFLVVKLVVLDDSASTTGDSTTAAAKFATVKLSLPTPMTAEMFVDGTRVGTVANDQTVGVKAGTKHIKLVGNNGVTCDNEKVTLEAGKTTTLECGLGTKPATGSGAGSAAATGSGSAAGSAAAAAQGSGAGAGSAKTSATKTDVKADASKTETKTDTTKSDVTKTDTTKTDSTKTDSTKTGSSTKDTSRTDTSKTDTSKTSTSSTKSDSSSTKSTSSTKSGTSSTRTSKSGGDAAKGDPTKGYLNVYSKPTAKILVDGAETGMKTPIDGNRLSLTPGKHKITFVIGDDRFTYPIIIKAGQTESMSKDLQ